MLTKNLFDPLNYLEAQLRLEDELSGSGDELILLGLSKLSEQDRKRAFWVAKTYKELLRMQLDAPKRELRPSVRKLLAQGKIKLERGKYLKGNE